MVDKSFKSEVVNLEGIYLELAKNELTALQDTVSKIQNQKSELSSMLERLALVLTETREICHDVGNNMDSGFIPKGLKDSLVRLGNCRTTHEGLLAEMSAMQSKRGEFNHEVQILQDKIALLESYVERAGVEQGEPKSTSGSGVSRKSGYRRPSIIMAQEMERNRIARELHDGPAQLMANIVLRADICRRHINSDPEKCDLELKTIKELVNESLNEIRRFIFDLRPMTLADLGLATTVKRYIQNTKTGWRANIEFIPVGEEVELDPDLALTVFRICQEALNNSKKHSEATNVWVTLAYESDAVRLIVDDNGVGFTPEYVNQDRPTPPLGLVSMQERAEVVGATIEIESTENKGTRVELVVPIRDEDLVQDKRPKDG